MSSRTTRAPAKKLRATSRIGQRRQVGIPKAVLDELQLHEGDLLEVTVHAGCVSMKPKRLLDLDETLTPSEAIKVRHGLKQLKQGNTRPWDQVKHELGL
jgi:AbrB family looped-hinge helix DNA binding protein